MQTPTFDPGLTLQYGSTLRRVINPDGSFNVRRIGASWRDFHPYLFLISARWPKFLSAIFAAYLLANLLFASIYYALGPQSLHGSDGSFLDAFFFSAHTLTTVGYGNVSPATTAANVFSVVEALFGLLGFAVATGTMFGRVSRASAKIGFSERAIVAPFQDGEGLEIRIVNRRPSTLMELHATVMLMTVDRADANLKRTYTVLKLEREKVYFFPLTWTIVHPLDSDSPLYGKTREELEHLQAELFVLIKAWDATFNQNVQARYSYRYDEIVWNAKFRPGFAVNSKGDLEVYVNEVGSYNLLHG